MFPLASCAALFKADRHLIGYASGNFGKAILLGSINVSLVFMLTDIIGMPAGQVGLLMLVVSLGDLVFDLAAGVVSLQAARRGITCPHLIALAALPCACAFAALYMLPLLDARAFVLVALLLLLMRASFALIDVPHNSLLARVTSDSRARGRASGYRTVFSAAASVMVATVIAPTMNVAAGAATPARLAWLGAGAGLLFLASLLLAAWSSAAGRAASIPRAAHACVLPRFDRLFCAIAAVAVVTGFALPMFGKSMLYVCSYVLGDAAFAGRVLLVLALSQIAGALLWIGLVRRHDKAPLLAASHALSSAGILLFACAGQDRALLLASTALAGLGMAGVFMLPWGMLADIVDVAEFRHRERRETAAFAVMLVLLKSCGAAAMAAIGATLDWLGYVPGAAQPASVLLGMKLLACGVPVLGSLLAILVLLRVRLGHALHDRLRRVNDRRRLRCQPA